MKCSDCKYFKTDECKLEPDAEFFIAESFDCFELDASKQASTERQKFFPQRLKDTGGNWGLNIGGILFWVGMVGILISLLSIALTCSRIYIVDTEDVGPIVVGGIVLIVSFFIALFGAIWWFIDWMEERKYWKSFETHDSSSDYNKPVKKP